MLKHLKEAANYTRTENGALAYRSTQSDCLDLFATIGALRRASDAEIYFYFYKAYAENPELAMKTLFYARDVRGGLGERRVFRVILRELASREQEALCRNMKHIPEFGRWDDLLELLETGVQKQAVKLLKAQFFADLDALEKGEEVSLLAKWLPSENASDPETVWRAVRLAASFGVSRRAYRKALTKLRARIRIIENNLRERDYSFDYSKQPSKAMFKYRKAFLRNDGKRYEAFMKSVAEGKAKLHADALLPYEVVRPVMKFGWCPVSLRQSEREAIDVTWNALPDYTDGQNALVVVDGSGSMYCGCDPSPAMVAQSLGIYFAERNTGAFHNHFITFSHSPQLVEIKGVDIVEKLRYCMSFNECANTNVMAVFELVLKAAVENNVPQEELPSTLYFISDMEFDACAGNADVTCFERARRMFEECGYELPQVVFWNVNSRNTQQPVRMNDRGVALASGASPVVFKQILPGMETPWEHMLRILGSERYACITA